ncbi:MOSC domain-containing protein [Paenibacillus sp. T1]|uniref:MOSC domain-containing protein n=2 Tax=Paenibacillus glycinis TaxID=2697035 RepID=A0ABW9XKU5_9BACL|nr:MOSC domain-containing protein [Paenibacillus glycinis]
MQATLGHISEINRFPVKSFGGERLEHCDLEPHGMLGDRIGAFYDETKAGWNKFVTARNIPDMLAYQARYDNGEIRVTGADGRTFGWNDDLLGDIQKLTSTPISMSRLKEPHPEHSQLMSVDEGSLLLVTDASIRRLAELWGKDVDQRRFRGNFVVTLAGGAPDEEEWLGRTLAIGDVRLRVDSRCERCVMITMDPDTRAKDPSLLKQVNQSFGNHFGVYASVVRTGRIRLGDQVEWIAESEAEDGGE